MGHGMGADFKPFGDKSPQVPRPQGAISIWSEDRDIKSCRKSGLAKHFCQLEILMIAVVPAGHYDRSLHCGKPRRLSPAAVRRENLVWPKASVACSMVSLRLIPNATPNRKKKGTAEWENSKYG